MPFTWKPLAQVRPATINVTSLYTPPSVATLTIINRVEMYNPTVNSVDVSLFMDSNGAVGDEDSALIYESTLPSDSNMSASGLCVPIVNNGTLLGQTSMADHVAYTVYGVEFFANDLGDGKEFVEIAQRRPGIAFTSVNLTGTTGTDPLDADYDYTLECLVITNTSASNSEYTVYNDIDGNVSDAVSGIKRDVILKNTSIFFTSQNLPLTASGSIAVECEIAGAVNFSLYGWRRPKRS